MKMLKQFKDTITAKSPLKDSPIKLVTPMGKRFAIGGTILILTGMFFLYKGCVECIELDFLLFASGILLILAAAMCILVSIKLDDKLVENY